MNAPITIRTLYLPIVKPILMFGFPLCSPCTKIIIIKAIESVQHNFFSFMSYRMNLPDPFITHNYIHIATKWKVPSLKSERNSRDVKFIYNSINTILI